MKARAVVASLVCLVVGLSVVVAVDYEAVDPPITACAFLCVGPHHTVGALEFVGTDWNDTEKADQDNGYEAKWGDNIEIPVPKTATKVYNCHAYAFSHTQYWINDPSNFFCENSNPDHRNGYKTWDDPGTKIYRFTGQYSHSARVGNESWPYKAKLGDGPIAYHNTETKYGSHSAIWEPRTYPDCGQ